MLRGFVKLVGGDPNKREIEKTTEVVDQINALEADLEQLSDEELRAKTDEFRARLASELEGIEDEAERSAVERDVLDELLPEAFAVVREASKRTLGQRHFDVQLIGGLVLHQGKIAEMRTGEGKTLVATLPLYLNAIGGHGVHLVTVNDYLARRDARWMGVIYHALGLSVGILQMAAVTENGKKAFLYDPEREHTHEDQDQMRLVDRVEAYRADITYGTNSEFGFDYLRDNMTMRLEDRVQRGHHFAIVDEVDNVLIDEARTPLIISGPASGEVEWYGKMAQLVRQLVAEDYEVDEKDRAISLTEIGTAHVEQLLGQPLRDPERPEDVTPEQARLLGHLEQALRAQHLFKRNKDYLVQGGKVIIVDEYTGRLMPGRRWSDGLHQAVEAKEGVKVEPENVTYATVTLQNYFRMYSKLAGMTGTALTEAEEFDKIYKLAVLSIPTNLEYQAMGQDAPLIEVKERDEDGYEYSYFARQDDQEKKVAFWRRKDYPDAIYRTAEAKLRSIAREIVREHVRGRPLLVGTTSVENSERLSNRLRAEPVRRLMQILLIRHAWLEANARIEDGRAIPELADLNKVIDQMRPEDLRPLAKQLGLSLNPEDTDNLVRLRAILKLEEAELDRLKEVLQGGVPHAVLNARKHTEESMIIAGAGAFGAVTIATNMAGRGVDIKLGGDLADEVIHAVNRVLAKTGVRDPYDLTDLERRRQLQGVDSSQYSIYEAEVRNFLQHFEDMEKVRQLGGLFVIGSERHEARRIDNQLRGRSARQGDPGASRFYLSLEDDLMRIFGGDQVKNVMERFSIDEDYPLQARMVNSIIEQSQHRVEGANFDMRKHTLEYDDVLNAQRMSIYGQRNRVFEKDDLSEDVGELLRQEVGRRVSEAVQADELWRLLGWLEQIQPPIQIGNELFPSLTYKLLLEELGRKEEDLEAGVLDLAERALQAEQDHFQTWAFDQIERTGDSLEGQIRERDNDLDTFLEGLQDRDETDTRHAQELADDLVSALRLPLRLAGEDTQLLLDDPRALVDPLREQISTVLTSSLLTRLVTIFEFRLGEPLGLNPGELQQQDWPQASGLLEERLGKVLQETRSRLVGEQGQIVRDIHTALEHGGDDQEPMRLRLLLLAAQGSRAYFDAKTHRQMRQFVTRLHYIYFAAQLLANETPEALEEMVLDHLQQAQAAQRRAWESAEAARMNFTPGSQQAEEFSLGLQNQIYRQVLLGSITELWVDYLTRVESLRISIGLEAYAQSDPLVKYKSQASEMFQSLLSDIRSAVISRIFLFRPRLTGAPQEEATAPAPAVSVSTGEAPQTAAPGQGQEQGADKKRKRHRH